MQPMFINLHSHVLAKLAARDVPWTRVARETGIPYETLKKIASGRTPNPGVQHVQKLADYFGGSLRASDRPAEPDRQAVPTPEQAFLKLADGLELVDRRTEQLTHAGPDRRAAGKRSTDIGIIGQGV